MHPLTKWLAVPLAMHTLLHLAGHCSFLCPCETPQYLHAERLSVAASYCQCCLSVAVFLNCCLNVALTLSMCGLSWSVELGLIHQLRSKACLHRSHQLRSFSLNKCLRVPLPAMPSTTLSFISSPLNTPYPHVAAFSLR